MNTKNFSVYISNTRAFNLVIDGIIYINSWFLKIRVSRIRISVVTSFISKFMSSMVVSPIIVDTIVSLVKLMQSISCTVAVKKIRLSVIIKQLIRLPATETLLSKIDILTSIKETLRMPLQSLAISKIFCYAEVIVAQYNILNMFDPQTLGALDTETLQDLDYNVV